MFVHEFKLLGSELSDAVTVALSYHYVPHVDKLIGIDSMLTIGTWYMDFEIFVRFFGGFKGGYFVFLVGKWK